MKIEYVRNTCWSKANSRARQRLWTRNPQQRRLKMPKLKMMKHMSCLRLSPGLVSLSKRPERRAHRKNASLEALTKLRLWIKLGEWMKCMMILQNKIKELPACQGQRRLRNQRPAWTTSMWSSPKFIKWIFNRKITQRSEMHHLIPWKSNHLKLLKVPIRLIIKLVREIA